MKKSKAKYKKIRSPKALYEALKVGKLRVSGCF